MQCNSIQLTSKRYKKNCDQYERIFTFNAMQCIDVNVLNDVVILAQTSGRVWWCIVRASDRRKK